LNFSRSDSHTKKVRIDNNKSKKNRSSTSIHSLEDEAEKQVEMQLLDSSLTEPKIIQPKKEVTRI